MNDQSITLPPAPSKISRRLMFLILCSSSLALLVALAFVAHLGIIPLPGEARYPQSWQPYTAPDGSFRAQIPTGWQVTVGQGIIQEGSLQTAISLNETSTSIRDPAPAGMVIFIEIERADNPVAWKMLICANVSAFHPPSNSEIAGYPAQYYPIGHDTFGRYLFDTSYGAYQISYRPAHFRGGGLDQSNQFGAINDWLHHDDAHQRLVVAQQVYQYFVASFNLGPYPPGKLVC